MPQTCCPCTCSVCWSWKVTRLATPCRPCRITAKLLVATVPLTQDTARLCVPGTSSLACRIHPAGPACRPAVPRAMAPAVGPTGVRSLTRMALLLALLRHRACPFRRTPSLSSTPSTHLVLVLACRRGTAWSRRDCPRYIPVCCHSSPIRARAAARSAGPGAWVHAQFFCMTWSLGLPSSPRLRVLHNFRNSGQLGKNISCMPWSL